MCVGVRAILGARECSSASLSSLTDERGAEEAALDWGVRCPAMQAPRSRLGLDSAIQAMTLVKATRDGLPDSIETPGWVGKKRQAKRTNGLRVAVRSGRRPRPARPGPGACARAHPISS